MRPWFWPFAVVTFESGLTPHELQLAVAGAACPPGVVVTNTSERGFGFVMKARRWHRVAYMPVVRVSWAQTPGRTHVHVVCHAETRELLLLLGTVLVFGGLGVRAGAGVAPVLIMALLYHSIGMFGGFWPGTRRAEDWVKAVSHVGGSRSQHG
jgi:hypothetical protein